MFNIKETANTLKSTAVKVNKEVLKTSEVVVEETIAAGEEWNKVFEKALKTGTTILGQQQELALFALEGLKKQYATGNVRLRKLLGFQTPEIVETVKATATTVEKKAKKVLSSTTKKVAKEVKATAPKTKKVLASTAKKAVQTAKPTAAKAKKVLATTAKKAAPKAATTKKVLATTKKAVKPVAKKATKIDLKVINGIGPKMEKVLNAAGFMTYADIATATEVKLKAVLLAENPRYAMYEPKEWIAEAKKLAKK